jgi:hypothetical protein
MLTRTTGNNSHVSSTSSSFLLLSLNWLRFFYPPKYVNFVNFQGLYIVKIVPRVETSWSCHPQQTTEDTTFRTSVLHFARRVEPVKRPRKLGNFHRDQRSSGLVCGHERGFQHFPPLFTNRLRTFAPAQIQSIYLWFQIRVRDSKFGTALVVTSSDTSGSYILGFRVDPEEKLRNLYKELSSLHSVYKGNPIFGVEYKWCSNKNEEPNEKLVEDVVEIEEPKGEMSNTLAAYLADEGHAKDRPPVYSADLGLAIESVKEGFTLQKLWEVLPS